VIAPVLTHFVRLVITPDSSQQCAPPERLKLLPYPDSPPYVRRSAQSQAQGAQVATPGFQNYHFNTANDRVNAQLPPSVSWISLLCSEKSRIFKTEGFKKVLDFQYDNDTLTLHYASYSIPVTFQPTHLPNPAYFLPLSTAWPLYHNSRERIQFPDPEQWRRTQTHTTPDATTLL
jgi:hypothetical protein